MSPQQLQEFEQMKKELKALKAVLDVPFIENAKRRIVNPRLADLGLDEIVSKTGTANTSGVLKSVSEAGAGSYSVADEYDGTLIVRDVDGNEYKLGYYTV